MPRRVRGALFNRQERRPLKRRTGNAPVFDHLTRLTAEPILRLMSQYRDDPSRDKVDLGIGVYRDSSGHTPVLDCVTRAEHRVLAAQSTKTYIGALGREEFNHHIEVLALGAEHSARKARRVRTIQTPGGCGALRLGAELINAATPAATMLVGNPTWGNHVPLLGASGLTLKHYAYYDPGTHELLFDQMLERLDQAAGGGVVLLHACCHNPSGLDPTPAQWRTLVDCLQRRRLVPFVDLAYQGLGDGLLTDVASTRLIFQELPEALLAVSFSKNLGLYRERVGALIVLGQSPEHADAVQSHMMQIARSIYSMPPDHGAAIAATILGDAELTEAWTRELIPMRERIAAMRAMLTGHLRDATSTDAFDFINTQRGMFSLLGIAADVVVRLREEHHIYMTPDGRINLAGLNPGNVAHVSDAIARALRAR
jgi:aspartate aminotransferase